MMAPRLRIPLDVPAGEARDRYAENYRRMTHDRGRLFLMAGDQKVEHLNDDFVGEHVSEEDGDPEHLFRIAAAAPVGCFATQLGLIARYGADYPEIPYLIKLNSKTHLVPSAQRDPLSLAWQDMGQIADFVRTSGLRVVGVGYTIYPGSENEAAMYTEAARIIFEAHRLGLLTVLWAYPRGKAVANESNAHLIAGAAGVAACLGSDFVKVNPPLDATGRADGALLREAVAAAGRCGVVCAGGKETTVEDFLERLHAQIHEGGTVGSATGRNVHQRSRDEAVRLCRAIHAITVEDASVEAALALYRQAEAVPAR